MSQKFVYHYAATVYKDGRAMPLDGVIMAAQPIVEEASYQGFKSHLFESLKLDSESDGLAVNSFSLLHTLSDKNDSGLILPGR